MEFERFNKVQSRGIQNIRQSQRQNTGEGHAMSKQDELGKSNVNKKNMQTVKTGITNPGKRHGKVRSENSN